MTNIDFTKSEQYTLSIRLSADGFSFSIHQTSDKECLYIGSYKVNASYSMTANIKEMIASTDALKHSYGKTNILIDTSRFTPVPFELFEDEQTEKIFYHNFTPIPNETILCNVLGKSNVALLFGMDKYACQLLGEHFPKARIFACISPLIEHFVQKSQKETQRNLYTHFHKDRMEIVAFEKGKLLFLNSYSCKHIADRVYYLLYVWQQLGFNQGNDRLWLTDTIEKKEELLEELRKFLRQVEIMQAEETLPFDIQTLMLCE